MTLVATLLWNFVFFTGTVGRHQDRMFESKVRDHLAILFSGDAAPFDRASENLGGKMPR
jgi:hypothetical protein